MGKNTKRVKAFIESIPDSKFKDFPPSGGNIASDINFRLDMQGMTSGRPQCYNIQVQVNRGARISSVKGIAPNSVSIALVPVDGSWSPSMVKQKLISKIAI